jgi:hypothetical protein
MHWPSLPPREFLFLLEDVSIPRPYCGRKYYINEEFQLLYWESKPQPSRWKRSPSTNCATPCPVYICKSNTSDRRTKNRKASCSFLFATDRYFLKNIFKYNHLSLLRKTKSIQLRVAESFLLSATVSLKTENMLLHETKNSFPIHTIQSKKSQE